MLRYLPPVFPVSLPLPAHVTLTPPGVSSRPVPMLPDPVPRVAGRLRPSPSRVPAAPVVPVIAGPEVGDGGPVPPVVVAMPAAAETSLLEGVELPVALTTAPGLPMDIAAGLSAPVVPLTPELSHGAGPLARAFVLAGRGIATGVRAAGAGIKSAF